MTGTEKLYCPKLLVGLLSEVERLQQVKDRFWGQKEDTLSGLVPPKTQAERKKKSRMWTKFGWGAV